MERIDLERRRLLARAGQGMVWVSTAAMAASLAGCGGGEGADPADPGSGSGGGGGGTAIGAAQRATTLTAVRDAVASLAAGSAGFDAQALAATLRTLPAVADVGVSESLGNVWARFTDGQWLVVPNALVPSAALGQRSTPAQAAGTDRRRRALAALRRQAAAAGEFDTPSILTGQQYRQLDMLGAVPLDGGASAAHLCLDWVDSDTLPRLRRMAVGLGFNLPAIQVQAPPDEGIDNGIEGLRDISGDGVFFVTAQCGQAGPDHDPRTVICTRTPADEVHLTRHAGELSDGVLVHAVQMVAVAGGWQAQTCLAITPAFASLNGWRFPDRCIGILNLAGAPALTDWWPVFQAAGLRHVLTWQAPVPWPRLLAFADDLVQMNLATNNFDGRFRRQVAEPRLRSYGMGETVQHLIDRGIVGDAGRDALAYLQEPQAALYVNTWLPTIDYLTLREGRGELELVGQFGAASPGEPGASAAAPHPSRTEPPQVLFGAQGEMRADPPGIDRAADPRLRGQPAIRQPGWEGGVIQVLPDDSELVRGGYVQVINGGRCSNAVPVTHWEIPVEVLSTVDDLTLRSTVSVRLRANVHPWRSTPDALPRGNTGTGDPLITLEGSVHSHMAFTASGSISHYDTSTRTRTTVSWSGSGGGANTMGRFVVHFSGQLHWTTRVVEWVVLTVTDVVGYQQRTLTEQFDINGALLRREEHDATLGVTLSTAAPGLSGLMSMAFDDRWSLRPGRFELLPVPSLLLPSPPQRQLRTVLSWPEVTADFPPLDGHGGS